MIPAGIMYGQLKISGRDSLEIRVLELAGDYLTFRLPIGLLEDTSMIEEISWYFFDWDRQSFCEVTLGPGEFDIQPTEGEYAEFCRYYRCWIERFDFVSQSKRLIQEYLRYIDLKLSLESDELAHELTGGKYPFDGIIMGHKHGIDVDVSGLNELIRMRGLNLALAVESPWELARMKELGTVKYIENRLGDASLSSLVNGLVLGNQFCYELIPEADLLAQVIGEALEHFEDDQRTVISVALPPIPEFMFSDICKEFEKRSREWKFHLNRVSFIVNDLGMGKYLESLGLQVREGVLMAKASRDPRKTYLQDDSSNLMVAGQDIYWPYYQTNTGTFCPLYASVINGDRGRQKRVTDCPGVCQGKCFEYPDHLNAVWRYNSIFGVSQLKSDIEQMLKGPDNGGITRVVLNL